MSTNAIEAQMHAECLNEAWCELCGISGAVSGDRRKVIEAEISVRIWAVIYLIQSDLKGGLSDDAKEVIREANAYNGCDLDDPVDMSKTKQLKAQL